VKLSHTEIQFGMLKKLATLFTFENLRRLDGREYIFSECERETAFEDILRARTPDILNSCDLSLSHEPSKVVSRISAPES
jgi:hypothetical protein